MASLDSKATRDRLRGFGPLGLLAIAVILASAFIGVPLSAALVLLWARMSQTPWSDLGLLRPKNWFLGLLVGIVFGVAFKLLMKAVVMPLLGAPPINGPYHFLAGNPAALPGMLATVIVAGGIAEEIFFRGFAFERLGKLFGHNATAKVASVLITSVLFGLAHYHDQGLAGVEQAAITGMVFGTIFALTGSLFRIMVAHAAFDVAAIALIYWNVEPYVAHFFFK